MPLLFSPSPNLDFYTNVIGTVCVKHGWGPKQISAVSPPIISSLTFCNSFRISSRISCNKQSKHYIIYSISIVYDYVFTSLGIRGAAENNIYLFNPLHIRLFTTSSIITTTCMLHPGYGVERKRVGRGGREKGRDWLRSNIVPSLTTHAANPTHHHSTPKEGSGSTTHTPDNPRLAFKVSMTFDCWPQNQMSRNARQNTQNSILYYIKGYQIPRILK